MDMDEKNQPADPPRKKLKIVTLHKTLARRQIFGFMFMSSKNALLDKIRPY